jgi:hypothetical protein
MKSIFNVLKNIRTNLAKPALKPLEQNANIVLKETNKKVITPAQSLQLLKNSEARKEALSSINNPLNKPTEKELQKLIDEKNYKDILDIKEKLANATNKKEYKKYGDEFIKITKRISSGSDKYK